MGKETIFIYLIRDGKVAKDECVCMRDERHKHRYIVYARSRNRQSIGEEQLDVVERNRVVSFEDNLPKFKLLIIEDMQMRIADAEKKLIHQKQILESIKQD